MVEEYKCSLCHDMGQREFFSEGGESRGWGNCECWKEKQKRKYYEKLIQEANLQDLKTMTYEKYKPSSKTQKEAFNIMSSRHDSYYLFGPYGVGKTHLMAASANREVVRENVTAFISVPLFLDLVRRAGRDNKTNLEEQARKVPYLCLDDMGKERESDWTEERLFLLLDARWKLSLNGQGKTSFTSQFPLKDLKNIKNMDGAIISRIRGMCKELFVDGVDWRGKG